MTKPLTLDQITLLKKSFRKIDTEKAASLFYSKLFERHPQLRPLFPSDMTDQSIKLMSVFELVVFSFEEKSHNRFELQEGVMLPLRDLGRKHDDKGIMPNHYTIANDLLLEVMNEASPEVMTDDTKLSWKLALDQLTFAMLNDPDANSGSGGLKGKTVREIFTSIKNKIRG